MTSSTFAAPSMLHPARCNAARGMGVRRILRSISCADVESSQFCPRAARRPLRPILATRRCGFKLRRHVPLRIDGPAPSARPRLRSPFHRVARARRRGAASGWGSLALRPFGGASWCLRANAGCGWYRLLQNLSRSYRVMPHRAQCTAADRRVGWSTGSRSSGSTIHACRP